MCYRKFFKNLYSSRNIITKKKLNRKKLKTKKLQNHREIENHQIIAKLKKSIQSSITNKHIV